MRETVILDAVRTPVGIGKPDRGSLAGVHPADLSAVVLSALVQRQDLEPDLIEDIIWGCVSQVGEQSSNIARTAALSAGFPDTVPGVTVDRQCGSSQQALHFAAAMVGSGQADLVVAGGVESMSRVPMRTNTAGGEGPWSPGFRERYEYVNQGISAEMIADRWGLSRTVLDELAVMSHLRAADASSSGRFAGELVPVQTDAGLVKADQGIRPDTSTEVLGGLRPVFREDGVVTAGNASQISDGAAAVLVASGGLAERLGVQPMARFHSFAVVGVDPDIKLTGPIPATDRLLDRSSLTLDDIDTFEVNEAFASVLGAWLQETGVEVERVNPDGGAIALGHPLGGSGARLSTTMLHRMCRENLRFGLQTMCEGGGMANAMVLERIG